MFGFGKKKNKAVDIDSFHHDEIHRYRKEIAKLKSKNEALRSELKAIKPVIESPDYKPPKSRECSDCHYAVYSPWDRISVIGCRKDSLCDDFKPKE